MVAPASIAASTTSAEKIELGAGGVFGRELDVVAVAGGPLHAGDGPAR